MSDESAAAAEDSILNRHSRLAKEIKEMKKTRRRLVQSVDICQQRIRDETTLRNRSVEVLEKMIGDYEKVPKFEKSAYTPQDIEKEFPELLDCKTTEQAGELLSEIDKKLRRCCLLEYELKSKFFLSDLLAMANEKGGDGQTESSKTVNPNTMDPKLASSLYIMMTKNTPVSSLNEESWVERWQKQFRQFTIVDENGDPLPERPPSEENTKKELLSLPLPADASRYELR